MSVRKITLVALLASLSIVLRYAFGPFPNIKPITAIFLVTCMQVGLLESVLVASLTMLVTGFLMGFGPWIFWQIGTYALVLLVWKYLILPLTNLLPRKAALWIQTIFAGLMGMLYGFVISIFSAVFYGSVFWPYWLNGLSYDSLHALSTVLFYPIILSIFRRFYHEKNH